MDANLFKAFGYLVIFLNAISFGSGLVEILSSYNFNSSQPMKASVAFCAIYIVGAGLIGLRKWAALYFSVPLLWFGLRMFLYSIEQVPFPWNLIGMSWGVLFMFPAALTVRLWPYLSWRGKSFF